MTIQTYLTKQMHDALKAAFKLSIESIQIETPKDKTHGDFSTNIAMQLAKDLRRSPMQIAETLLPFIHCDARVESIEIARPGFINFTTNKRYFAEVIPTILAQGSSYGNLTIGSNEHYNIEYVSVNPTGSLHIGHARGAAAGDTLSRILKKAGFEVTREFYVNDGGNQIHQLTLSIEARYKQTFNIDCALPEDGYYGPEITRLAEHIKTTKKDTLLNHPDAYDFFRAYGVDYLLSEIKDDLARFDVTFDVFFSEASLYQTDAINQTLSLLKEKGYTYELDGALWLKTSDFGDSKDRVIIKSDQTYTYLLPDIAYHHHKVSRGYTKLIDILGGDHHGYVPRLQASIEMVVGKKGMLEVDLLQMVKVIEDGVEVKMSKRSGKALSLRDLIDSVGKDPIRYFFAMRSLNTHMDLDLDLALKQSNENPVYYAQYAHARISSLLEKAQSLSMDLSFQSLEFERLNDEKSETLITLLVEYPQVIEEAATKRIVHRIPQYINRLATALHSFYAGDPVIAMDPSNAAVRLALLKAVQIVLSDALNLIGVTAKNKM